jgi:DNA (cytosine-5)-methyltransferase 1
MLEKVRGFLGATFADYRAQLKSELSRLGYDADWQLLNASNFGVSQLRPRVVIVALRKDISPFFNWPLGSNCGRASS